MHGERIPGAVQALLYERIDSAAQLEILLLLRRDTGRSWSADALAAELRLERAWVERQLADLKSAGFLTYVHGRFAYAPSAPVAATMDELARVYAERPAAVITFIFTKPQRSLRSFADAFRLRENPPSAPPRPPDQPPPAPPPAP